jgi:C4-type Zn-finger protein
MCLVEKMNIYRECPECGGKAFPLPPFPKDYYTLASEIECLECGYRWEEIIELEEEEEDCC